MWHMKIDRWEEVNLLSKYQLHSSYDLGLKVTWKFAGKLWLAELINESVTKIFVEQSGYTGSVNNFITIFVHITWI